MCWLPKFGGGDEKILHLRMKTGDRWLPYTAPEFARYRQPDSSLKPALPGKGKDIPLSKGMPTAQILLNQGWVYIKSDEAYSDNPTEIKKGAVPECSGTMKDAIARAKEFGFVQ